MECCGGGGGCQPHYLLVDLGGYLMRKKENVDMLLKKFIVYTTLDAFLKKRMMP